MNFEKLKNVPRMIRVWPKEERYRILRHPVAGALKPGDGGTLWPRDSFTTRCIADGALLTSKPEETDV